MQTKQQKWIFGSGCLLLLAIPFWRGIVAPQLTKLPADFSYSADIISLDNFYDEQAKEFSGEKRSVTKFSYDVVGQKQDSLIMKNAFDVRTVTGENIFAVDRLYGIDAKTGQHIAGAGDRDRDGYLFAPRHLRKGQEFTYWHINYDGPAHMTFAAEETLFGLPVYRYETRYSGIQIDQTENLRSLPDVGVTRGVVVEPFLQIWIEPISGMMVKYKDDSIAYFYDLRTGQKLHPWNHFSNTYTVESVLEHVQNAQRNKAEILFVERHFPLFLAFFGSFLILLFFRKSVAGTLLLIALGATVVLFVAHILLARGAGGPDVYAGPSEKIRIGAEAAFLPSTVWVAEHKGYFQEQGIDLEITQFSSGRAALTSMLKNGNLDIVTVAQTPFVYNSLERDDFVMIAGMVTSSNDVKILGRRDRDIKIPADLRGKKIGITKGSTGHYFLGLFLAQHGLELRDVTSVDIDASSLSQAVIDGTVDAIATWEPHIYRAKKSLGDDAVALESSDTFREDFYFTVFRQWATAHPELVKRFLVAIDRGAAFIADHPQESQKIVAEKLHFDPALVSSVWKDYNHGIFLDQAILLTLEQQAHWMMTNGLTDSTAVPNYLHFMYFDALEAIKPEAVTVLR